MAVSPGSKTATGCSAVKVLHVIPSIGPLRGGPSVVLPSMARSLVRAGLEVTIVTTDDNGPDAHLDVPRGEPIMEEGVTVWYFRRQTRFYTFSFPLARWLARHVREYDLVHIHALFSYAALPASISAAQTGVPYIVRPLGTLSRWGTQQRRPLLKRLSFYLIESRILASAAAIHYTSEQERREAIELGAGGVSRVIPIGVDPFDFAFLPPPDQFVRAHPTLAGRTVILFLSRLDEKKGLDLLLPAFANALAGCPDIALVIAGSGARGFERRLRESAQRLGIQDALVWPGFLSGRDKLAALSAADAFVLPSYSENFGIAAVEAMAAGRAVLLSDQVAVSAEVKRLDAGLVVPCDVDALSAALERLIRDADLRRKLAENGHTLVEQRFSSEAVTREVVALYDHVLSRVDRKSQV